MTHDAAVTSPELVVERAVRLAAECGNRLLSGSVAEVIGAETPEAHAIVLRLRDSLAQMGVRLLGRQRGSARDAADFVFVAGSPGELRVAELLAHRLRSVKRLPSTMVVMGDTPDPEAVAAALAALSREGSGVGGPLARWRLRAPRAQIAEFRLGSESVALAVPAGSLPEADERSRIAESAGRMDWARRGMRATAALAAELRENDAIHGTRVGVSLVLEPKTAALALLLREAGAEVAVFAPVGETDPAVAAALAKTGISVFAPQLGDGVETVSATRTAEQIDAAHAAALLDWAPELLIDDGSHLVRLAHTERSTALTTLRAASEETTSGVRPLIEMAAEGELRIPVIAVNDARTKSEFDNRIGTGQSCVFAIAGLLDTAPARSVAAERIDEEQVAQQRESGVAGSQWVVVGYGPVGVGVARFASALGARVTIVERDAVRALQALHDGHEVDRIASALPIADVAVSATGVWHTLEADELALLRPGAAVAVAGGIDDELALDVLRERGWQSAAIGPNLAIWRAPDAFGGLLVLAGGAGVNYTAGEGNPIEVMDLSFATQLASLARIAAGCDEAGVHMLDSAAERRVADAALYSHGASVDRPEHTVRPGGAAQHWTAHRYRGGAAQ